MIHPITFSIPEEKIVNTIPKKTKVLATIIPGNKNTYIYNNEEDYYNDYKQSLFAITGKKCGWDCMRHYEILANGCLPYFQEIEKCPKNTLTLFPKELIYKCNKLFTILKYIINNKIVYDTFHNGKINPRLINQLKSVNSKSLPQHFLNEYNILLSELLEYMRATLTTQKVAKYILEKSGNQTAQTILFLSGNTDPDYLRCLTLHGFKQLFGTKCHDFPKVPHLYKSDTINYTTLYGKGMTYSNLLDQSFYDDTTDINVEECIKNHYYDIIIYGSYHRGMPMYDLVMEWYKPKDVLLLCGEDIHLCNCKDWVNKGDCVFVRELE
jgi:hypothetical protein